MKTHRFSFQNRLMLDFSVLTLLSLLLVGVVSSQFTSNLIHGLRIESLQAQVQAVTSTIQIATQEALERQNISMDHWSKEILPNLVLDKKNSHAFSAQIKGEKKDVMIPSLTYQSKPLVDHSLIDHVAQATEGVATLMVKTDAGFVRVSTNITTDKGERAVGTLLDPTSKAFESVSQGKRFIGRSKILGKFYLTAYEPIMQNGEVAGVFFLGVPDRAGDKFTEFLGKQKILEHGYFFVFDSKGKMLLHPTLAGQDVLDMKDADDHQIFQDMVTKGTGTLEYRWAGKPGEAAAEKLSFFEYLPEYDWHIVAALPMEEAKAAMMKLRWILFTVISCSFMVMLLATYWFGRRTAKDLEIVNEKMNESAEEATRSSEAVLKNSEDLASASTQAAASLEETVASLEQISSQIKHTSELTVEATGRSRTTAQAADHGHERMQHLIEAMRNIQADSKRIQEMSDLIDDIAFQTSLLSLNASVEAARAGEAGKGFNVVAEAVRDLAGKASEAAKSITQVLNANQIHIEEGVKSANETEESLKEIVGDAQHLLTLVSEIEKAAQEQTIGVSQISMGMNQLDQATQTNAASAQVLNETATNLSKESDVLQSSVTELTGFVRGGKKAA